MIWKIANEITVLTAARGVLKNAGFLIKTRANRFRLSCGCQ